MYSELINTKRKQKVLVVRLPSVLPPASSPGTASQLRGCGEARFVQLVLVLQLFCPLLCHLFLPRTPSAPPSFVCSVVSHWLDKLFPVMVWLSYRVLPACWIKAWDLSSGSSRGHLGCCTVRKLFSILAVHIQPVCRAALTSFTLSATWHLCFILLLMACNVCSCAGQFCLWNPAVALNFKYFSLLPKWGLLPLDLL